MARRRRSRNRSGIETRARILKVSMTMFAAGGYEATSLRQIAGAADIDVSTLKYHFVDKETLFAEVYRIGHKELLAHVEPVLSEMAEVRTREQMQQVLRKLVREFHDFVEDNFEFARMVLFRMLEDPSNMSELERELQGLAIAMVERTFKELIDQGVIRPVDTRAVISLLAMALPMWMVTAEVKPEWLGDPNPFESQEGRERSEAFFCDLLLRYCLD